MDEQMKRVAIVALIVTLIFVGFVAAYVLKTYDMSANTEQRNLRLYRDAGCTQVIPLTYAWTELVSQGTVIPIWARNDGNVAANFTISVLNPVNCTIGIDVDTFMNVNPGDIRPFSLTIAAITPIDATGISWQLRVNTNPP